MTLWLIEPRDPILLRDGRPFGLAPGARAASLDFPFPSTVAGAVRTQVGLAAHNPFRDDSALPLLQIPVRGPLLVELPSGTSSDLAWYAPSPADAAVLADTPVDDEPRMKIRRLLPVSQAPDTAVDLEELSPVGMLQPDKAKSYDNAPRFWSRDKYLAWLTNPHDDDGADPILYGHGGPVREQRVHVTIRPEQQTAQDGRLFQTSGLEFVRVASSWTQSVVLGLAVAVDTTINAAANGAGSEFEPGFATLGGERRLVRWRTQPGSLPTCPDQIVKAVIRDRACRVLLLTPAAFANGDRPQDMLHLHAEVRAIAVGSAVPRAQTVSGWDYARHVPKPSRRLAPAGSVFFLKLAGTDHAVAEYVQRIWMQCVSDGMNGSDIGQANRDGFGLAVVGVWPEGKEWKENPQ